MTTRNMRSRRWVVTAALLSIACGCDTMPVPGSDGGVLDARVPLGDGSAPDTDGSMPGDGGVGPVVPGADPSFGAGGLALVNVGDLQYGPLWSVVVQPDGKVLAAGRTIEAIIVVRSLPDGTLDRSFGSGGIASVPCGSLSTGIPVGAGGLALAPDGSIVVSGIAMGLVRGTVREIVARLTPAGALDPTFGGDGIVIGDYSVPEGAVANAVAVQSDARVIVAARGHVDRLSPDGTLDPSFGSGGRFESTLGGRSVDYQALAADGAGRIVLSGVHASPSGKRVVVLRLTAAGALDTSFGGGAGYVLDSASGGGIVASTQARSLALDASGRIVLAATRTEGRSDLSVGRFSADGALDASFGAGGWASATDGVSYAGTTARLALESDGGIVAIGGAGVGGEPAQLVRFTEDGSLDTTFGAAGIGGFNAYDGSLGLAVGAGDAIFVTGQSAGLQVSLQRMDADGALDATFAGDGALELPTSGGPDGALAVAVQADGRIVLGGTGDALNVGAVVRLMPDGSVDSSFATDGRLPRAGFDAIESIAVDASGRILIGGPSGQLRAVRLLSDGSVDPSFGTAGMFSAGLSRSANIAMGSDGSVYLAGFARGTGGPVFGVKRLLDDGTADPAFGTGGETLVPLASDGDHALIVVQPDGRVVASAEVLVRLDAAGALDPTFGTDGIVTDPRRALALAIAPDGAIVRAMMDVPSGSDVELVVERRLADGTLDSTFGTGGSASVPLGTIANDGYGVGAPVGLSIDAGGSIVVATASGSDGFVQRTTRVRLAPDGSLDASFGTGGREVLTLGRGSSAFHAMASTPGGSTLLVGRAMGPGGTSDFMVLALR